MKANRTASVGSSRDLALLSQFWLLALVVCIGAGLISAAVLGVNLRIVWLGSSILSFGVVFYVLRISYLSRRRSRVLHTQLDQALARRRVLETNSTVRDFPVTRH